MGNILTGIFLIAVGLFGVASGFDQVRKALSSGTFYGWSGVRYREERRSVAFYANLSLRVLAIAVGIWMIWFGAGKLAD